MTIKLKAVHFLMDFFKNTDLFILCPPGSSS